jgi:hypothetical protein
VCIERGSGITTASLSVVYGIDQKTVDHFLTGGDAFTENASPPFG